MRTRKVITMSNKTSNDEPNTGNLAGVLAIIFACAFITASAWAVVEWVAWVEAVFA